MPFCAKCGASVGEGAAFCPSCGSTNGSSAAPIGGLECAGAGRGGSGRRRRNWAAEENIAGLLCYVLGWVTGVIFYIIDKRPFVRFHAAQSIVVFGGIAILYVILGMFLSASLFAGGLAGAGGFSIGFLLYPVLGLVAFILWILLMVKAYGHQEIPGSRWQPTWPRRSSAFRNRGRRLVSSDSERGIPRPGRVSG